MNYSDVEDCADRALEAVVGLESKHGKSPVLESIKNQMIFVRDNARVGKNPVDELPDGKSFTFGILSSREFASPEELLVKEKLNRVARLLF
ncbi:immunity protein Tsi6 family protein [Microbulbifer sp. Q7]|uniref:immunity protein Tsi6 family protein n=1 Tax=Microbulbifer sp. Q7 TaxID=1785091 RepID=UPI00128FEBA3|nr:immunity protein Tsi6 family protein [Microbulbifer sp. Q7]